MDCAVGSNFKARDKWGGVEERLGIAWADSYQRPVNMLEMEESGMAGLTLSGTVFRHVPRNWPYGTGGKDVLYEIASEN